MSLLPQCSTPTAYVTVWTGAAPPRDNGTAPKGTFFMSMKNSRDFTSLPLHRVLRPAQLILVLLRSLRRVERRCRRDFIVLLGTHVRVPLFERRMLKRAGARFVLAPPLLPGVPTADKLWIWRLLGNYSQCLVLDSDVMVLQPLDDLFGRPEEVTIAHHPYDTVQAQCGIPLERRGVAAMIVMRPNATAFEEYVGYVQRRLHGREQLMYADQTGLMCYFGLDRTRTLPCSYLFDVANPLLSPGQAKWKGNCLRLLGRHLRMQCLNGSSQQACRPAGGVPATCRAVLDHLHGQCEWRRVASSVRAVHFKGKVKPWPGLPGHKCRRVMHGPLRMQGGAAGDGGSAVSALDDLEWAANASQPEGGAGVCVSGSTRAPVFWARGEGKPSTAEMVAVPRKCCHLHTLLSAEWNGLLTLSVFGGSNA